MQDQLISFETAKIAKEKGFNLRSKPYRYNSKGELTLLEGINAPTQSLLQRWLREVHDINVLISFETIDDSTTAYIWNTIEYIEGGKGRKKDTWDFYNRHNSFKEMMWYDTYEEALEEGLIEGLKLIKTSHLLK